MENDALVNSRRTFSVHGRRINLGVLLVTLGAYVLLHIIGAFLFGLVVLRSFVPLPTPGFDGHPRLGVALPQLVGVLPLFNGGFHNVSFVILPNDGQKLKWP